MFVEVRNRETGWMISITKLEDKIQCITSYLYNYLGTVIHSDEWAAYRNVTTLPNVASHHTVNHSISFVEPITGTHTQHVESYWSRAKLKLKRMKGCHAHQLPSYLDEFLWRERWGQTKRAAIDAILNDIAIQYSV